MTFDDDARLGRNRVSRRGRTGLAVGGGGGAVVIIALFLISQFTGVDLTGLAGGAGEDSDTPLTKCTSGADANREVGCRDEGAAEALDAFWSAQDVGYTEPDVILFTDSVDTGCGGATTAVGPTYCPADQTVYLDTAFYDELRITYGSSGGPLAQLYVVAHEFGHHIQHLLGTTDGLDTSATGPASNSVRLELQADCYAGAWAGSAATTPDGSGTPFLEPITDAQLQDALSAAAAVGDDRIQRKATGQVQREAWTHGSSAQRQRWFSTGYRNGWRACDTFAAPASGL